MTSIIDGVEIDEGNVRVEKAVHAEENVARVVDDSLLHQPIKASPSINELEEVESW